MIYNWIADEAEKHGCTIVEYTRDGYGDRAVMKYDDADAPRGASFGVVYLGLSREERVALEEDSHDALEALVRREAREVAMRTRALSLLDPAIEVIEVGARCPFGHEARVVRISRTTWLFVCERHDGTRRLHTMPVRVAAGMDEHGRYVIEEKPADLADLAAKEPA